MSCGAGYELPPLMFTENEAEGIAVGVRLLARTGAPACRRQPKASFQR